LIVEIVLAGLLAATVACCVLLERRLRQLRSDQTNLAQIVLALNTGIAQAKSGLAGLRGAADEASEDLGRKLSSARAITDELSLLTQSGEKLAQRLEAGRLRAPAAPAPRAASPSPRNDLRAVR